MANLLPKEEIRTVSRVFHAQLIAVLALMLIASALIAIGAFTPSFLMLRFISISQPVSVSPQAASDTSAVADSGALIALLSPMASASSSVTAVVEKALALKPSGVSVTHISYNAGTPGQLVIAGTASSPALLTTYQQALRADPTFSSVVLPVSSLFGGSNGSFNVTLTGNF